MGRDSLIKIGRIIFFLFGLLILFINTGFALELETEISPGRIELGSSATIQIKISGASDAEPVKIPQVSGLEISFAGTMRSYQNINGKSWSGMVLNFSVTPQQSGKFQIPPVIISADNAKYKSKEVSLLVIKGSAKPNISTDNHHKSNKILPEITLSKKKAYSGEPIIARYYILHPGVTLKEAIFEKMPETKGFLQKQIQEKLEDETKRSKDGEFIKTHIATFIFIPTERGAYKVGGGSVIVSLETEDFFSFGQRRRIIYDSEDIHVVDLPEAGKPREFDGNVGRFSMDVEYNKSEVKAFDEKKIKIIIRGDGNVLSISKPVVNEISGVKIIKDETGGNSRIENNLLKGEREFSFTIIPERPGIIDIGNIVFYYFDPVKSKYEKLNSQRISFNVKAGSDKPTGMDLKKIDEGPDFNIIIIFLIILAVGGIIVIVVVWERNKFKSIVENTAVKQKSNIENKPEEKGERYEIYYKDLIIATKRGDVNHFLKITERILNRISNEIIKQDYKLEDYIILKIRDLKERISKMKYGGVKVTDEQIKTIFNELKDILGRIKK